MPCASARRTAGDGKARELSTEPLLPGVPGRGRGKLPLGVTGNRPGSIAGRAHER